MTHRIAAALLAAGLGAAVTTPIRAQAPPEPLFAPAQPPSAEIIQQLTQPQIVRLGFGLADVNLIAGPDRPEGADALLLNLFDDVRLIAVRNRLERRSRSSFTWFGHVSGNDQTNVILVVRDGRLTGSILTSSQVFDVVALDGDPRSAIRRIDQSLYGPEEPPDQPPPPARSASRPAKRPSACAADDFIDVMVVYTADADAAPGDIQGEIQAAVDDANQSYENSGLVQRLRLVHAEQVDYVESGDTPTDRNRLKDPGDGFMDGVHAVRDTYGADVVSLWTNTGNYCGYAYIMETVDAGFEDRAFSAVVLGCAVGNHSFAHELGHNMSARHDRYVDNTDGSPYDDNHGLVNIDAGWRTIMAYNDACEDAGTSCTRLQYWSNPDLTYGGDPMGIAPPDAEAADNHTTLNTTRTTVQQFRDAHAPTANAGPDQVAECGQPVTLDGSGSCDPDGDPLTYAWSGGFEEGGGNATGAMPVVTFPKGIHPVTLVVNDGTMSSVPDTVSIDATADTTDPDIICPADVVVSCDAPTDPSATGSATATDACDAVPAISFADVETPGACAQEKTIQRTWTAVDDDGNDASCVQTITVDDAEAPVVTCGIGRTSLWPPNHKFANVGFHYQAEDDCDAAPGIAITVTSDEDPALAEGAGGPVHCPDAQVDNASGTVLLRAERSGAGDGRVYVVTVTATDACGNAASCSEAVVVPQSKKPGAISVDSGQTYDAMVCSAPPGGGGNGGGGTTPPVPPSGSNHGHDKDKRKHGSKNGGR